MGPGMDIAVFFSPGAELVAGRENAVAAGDDPAGEDVRNRAGGLYIGTEGGQFFLE